MPTFDSIRPKVFRAYCDIITPGTSTVVLCPRQQYRNVCKISIRPEQSVMVNALIMSAPFPPYVRLTFPFLTEVPVRPGADCSKACNNIAALQPKTQRAFANLLIFFEYCTFLSKKKTKKAGQGHLCTLPGLSIY